MNISFWQVFSNILKQSASGQNSAISCNSSHVKLAKCPQCKAGKKIYLMSAPQGDMRFDWQKAESGFWSCVLTSSSSSCLLSWWAPHYPFKQKWQTTVPLPGCSHTQWELGWGQSHWLNISLFQDKQVVWIKVGQNRLNIIKRGYKTRIEWCSASLHSLGDSRTDRGNKEEQNS